MILKPIEEMYQHDAAQFHKNYLLPEKPVVLRGFAKQWPAYTKWNWNYFIDIAGDKTVPIYNNSKASPDTPVNCADDYKTMREYIEMISKGPASWRIFLFNLFDHAPQLLEDFTWPEDYMQDFLKKYPMLFFGGEGSITHLHFDMDFSHILHTNFVGSKRVLLFPFEEKDKLYRKPWEVLSMADLSHYYLPQSEPTLKEYPALKYANGLETVLEHGDTLFMPAGYWHHIEYIESGFSMSLRAMHPSIAKRIRGLWYIMGMRNIDSLMKKTAPNLWQHYKENKLMYNAERELSKIRVGVRRYFG